MKRFLGLVFMVVASSATAAAAEPEEPAALAGSQTLEARRDDGRSLVRRAISEIPEA